MLLFCQILIKLDNSNCKLTRYFINIILHSIHKPQISILKSPLELCSLATGGTQETSNLNPQTSNPFEDFADQGIDGVLVFGVHLRGVAVGDDHATGHGAVAE